MQLDNLLKRDFTTQTINEKWVADITYIHTLKDGWCYLASVLDLHSKKIVGYSFSHSMTTELVIKAFDNAHSSQKPSEGLVLHTDLGSQYTSSEFTHHTQNHHIKQSFSQKGCPYDSAYIESFHAILKKEEVNHVQYLDYQTAKLAIFQFIDGWYNRKRIHSSLRFNFFVSKILTQIHSLANCCREDGIIVLKFLRKEKFIPSETEKLIENAILPVYFYKRNSVFSL